MGSLVPIGRAGTTHFVNLVALAGVIFSGLGFLYTFLQLRDNNDRIDGYRDFYRWVRRLFKELEEGKADKFYFYGPTILPGNVAVGDTGAADITWFREELDDLFRRRDRFKKVKRFVVIVPPIEKYIDSYRHFHNARMSHFEKRQSLDAWREFVESKQLAAVEFQKELAIKDGGEKLTPRDSRYDDIKSAYFFSNGRRVIYAKPLHYVSAPESGEDLREQTPHLVGFTTTDSVTIDAFQEHFSELSHDRDRDRLQAMYNKHLVSPRYLDEVVQDLELRRQLSVEALAVHDHDHFGGKDSTDKFLGIFEIKPGDRVLDIGSGFGGPARYIAEKSGCSVYGIELQTDRYEWAMQTTRKVGLQERVKFSDANACNVIDELSEKYNYAIAFLSILHFPGKEKFLKALGRRIEKGGGVYIEDYVRERELRPEERTALANVIACPDLLLRDRYIAALREGGLEEMGQADNPTPEWMKFAEERVSYFESNEKDIVAKFGKNPFTKAQQFNIGVVQLFKTGVVHGIRIVAKKS